MKEEINRKKKDRLSKWSRSQLVGDVIRLWQVEKDLHKELERLSKLLRTNHICYYCGSVNVLCDCPFG